MEQRDIRREKEYWEKECADIFVDWLNRTTGIKYIVEKAEEKFPDLVGSDRWDFVATQESCSDWIAIEVEEVTVPEEHTVPGFWDKVFRQVNREVRGKLKGTFFVVGPPDFAVKLRELSELAEAISQVILEKSTQITSSFKPIDIWPDIIRYLPNWSSSFLANLNTLLNPGKISKAQLYLHKYSDEGSYVGIAMYSSSSWTVAGEQKAAEELFKPKRGRVRPNHQLGVAKARGANSGFLLLNADDWQIEDIRRALAAVSHADLCNIDAAYLLDVSHRLVYQVWPMDKKTTTFNK